MDTETARIRALNDELRHKLTGGTVMMTQGVAALGCEAVARIVKTLLTAAQWSSWPMYRLGRRHAFADA